jgi:hypothetical protein
VKLKKKTFSSVESGIAFDRFLRGGRARGASNVRLFH